MSEAKPWEKYQSNSGASTEGGAPWEKYAATQSETAPNVSKLDSAVRGYQQGSTLGFADEIAGAGEKVGTWLAKIVAGDKLTDESKAAYDETVLKGAYSRGRDEHRAKDAEARAANPGAFMGGELTGAALTSVVPGLNIAKGAKVGTVVGKSALAGGLTGAGASEADLTKGEVLEVAKDAAMGAGLGGTIGGVGQAATKFAPALKKGANNLAARSIGRGTQALKEKIGDKGLQEMGEAILEHKIVGAIPRGIKKLNERIVNLRAKVGESIGSAVDDIDTVEKMLASQGQKVGVSKQGIMDRVKAEVLNPDSFPDEQFVKKVENRLENFMSRGGKAEFLPTKGIHEIKKGLGQSMEKGGAWKRIKMGQPTPDDLFNLSLYDALGESIVESSKNAAKISGMPQVDKISGLNKLYSQFSDMKKIAKHEIARTNTNNLLMQLTPVALGGAAYAGGQDPETALGIGLSALIAKRAGPQVGAKLLSAASKQTQNAPLVAKLATRLVAPMAATKKDPLQMITNEPQRSIGAVKKEKSAIERRLER